MKYDTIINLARGKKSIVIFLKGHKLTSDAIVDVEIHQKSDGVKAPQDKVLDKPTLIDLEARWGDKGQDG